MIQHRLASTLIVVIALSEISTASADTTVWITNSGRYNDPGNWSAGIPNSADDSAIFQRGAFVTYTVTFTGSTIFGPPVNYINGTLSIGSNNVTFADSSLPIFDIATFTNNAFLIGGPPSEPAILNTSLQKFNAGIVIVGFGSGSQGLVNVTGGNMNVTGSDAAAFDLTVGNEGNGTINVLNGAKLNVKGGAGNATVGANIGVNGNISVSGAGSTWNNESDSSSPLVIGQFGNGNLDITNGGQVNDHDAFMAMEAGSTGIVTLSGAGSTWTNRGRATIGVRGNGFLSLTNGAQVVDDESFVGTVDNAIGTVTVSVAGSKWQQVHDLNIGIGGGLLGSSSGKGFLNIVSGGQVITGGDAFIGDDKESAVTMSGVGSTWIVGGTLQIDVPGSLSVGAGATTTISLVSNRGTINVAGASATLNVSDVLDISTFAFMSPTSAALNVTGGGHANARVAFVGSSRSGQASVSGPGSKLEIADQLYVGLTGVGDLAVTGGGQVTSNSGQLGVMLNSTGSAKISGAGSRWTTAGDFNVGVAGAGELSVLDAGGITVGGLLKSGPRGFVEGNSTITGNVRNAGTVAPGMTNGIARDDAFGTLHIDGNYTQAASGVLDIQINSTSTFDKLTIAGHAALDGTLKVALTNGFLPAVGNTFQVLTAGSVSGTFDLDFSSLSSNTGDPGWIVLYSDTDVVLKWVSFPQGDFNRNGIVDAADYTIWRDTLGSTTDLRANGDNTGASANVIDLADFTFWKTHFGAPAGSGSGGNANSAAPEPASLVMLLLGMLAMCFRRRTEVS